MSLLSGVLFCFLNSLGLVLIDFIEVSDYGDSIKNSRFKNYVFIIVISFMAVGLFISNLKYFIISCPDSYKRKLANFEDLVNLPPELRDSKSVVYEGDGKINIYYPYKQEFNDILAKNIALIESQMNAEIFYKFDIDWTEYNEFPTL